MKKILKKIDLFSHFSENEFTSFIDTGQIRVLSIEKNYYLLQEGSLYKALYITISGICTAEMGDISGKSIQIDEFKSPHIIGIGFFFGQNNILPVSIKAKTDLKVVKINKTAIFKLLRTDEVFLSKFMVTLSSRIEFLTTRIRFLNFNTIREKLANYLLTLTKGNSNTVTLPLKIFELADFFGVTRPSLSQVFIEMAEEDIFEKNKNEIIIKDRRKLLNITKKRFSLIN